MSIYSSRRKPGAYIGNRPPASAILLAGVLGTPAAADAETLAQRRTHPITSPPSRASSRKATPSPGPADPVALMSNGEALPAAFDLRDSEAYGNAVTPVKFQNPVGHLRAFGVVAASETSILSETHAKGIEVPEALTDLSERRACLVHLPRAAR